MSVETLITELQARHRREYNLTRQVIAVLALVPRYIEEADHKIATNEADYEAKLEHIANLKELLRVAKLYAKDTDLLGEAVTDLTKRLREGLA